MISTSISLLQRIKHSRGVFLLIPLHVGSPSCLRLRTRGRHLSKELELPRRDPHWLRNSKVRLVIFLRELSLPLLSLWYGCRVLTTNKMLNAMTTSLCIFSKLMSVDSNGRERKGGGRETHRHEDLLGHAPSLDKSKHTRHVQRVEDFKRGTFGLCDNGIETWGSDLARLNHHELTPLNPDI
jgi:hypothetical protein